MIITFYKNTAAKIMYLRKTNVELIWSNFSHDTIGQRVNGKEVTGTPKSYFGDENRDIPSGHVIFMPPSFLFNTTLPLSPKSVGERYILWEASEGSAASAQDSPTIAHKIFGRGRGLLSKPRSLNKM